MKTLLALFAVVAMLRLAGRVLVLHRMLRTRVRRVRYRVVAEETVPAVARESFATPARELEELGFQPAGWMAMEREGADDATTHGAVLFHPAALACATVAFADAPEPARPWSVAFSTFSSGDRVFRSIDGSTGALASPGPGLAEVTSYEATLAGRWKAHREATVDVIPVSPGLDAAVALADAREQARFEALVRDGSLFPAERGAYGFSWRQALRATRETLAATRMARTLARKRRPFAPQRPLHAVPVEAEVAAYRRALEAQSGPPRASFLAAVFAVTVPLYLAATSYWSGSAPIGALVFATVLFHELGHYLAMRALGYVDTTIFFIPFLGGVAAGRKDQATTGQRMIVLLAGPLPGLLVACAAIAFRVPVLSPTSGLLVILLVAINLFNLLPVLPLDGGQIAHMLLFARQPWLDVAFRALAGAGLLAVAWEASSVTFGLIGALTLLQLPRARRLADLRRKLRAGRAASPGAPEDRLFFEAVRDTPDGALPFARKMALGQTVLAEAWLDVPVRLPATIAWLGAYALTIGVGIASLVLGGFGPLPRLKAASLASPRPEPRVEADVPLTPLPPAGPVDSAIVTEDPHRMVRVAFGVFESPEAAAAARERMSAAVPRDVLRPLGPVLFVWAPMPAFAHPDQDVDQAFDAALKAAREGARAAVTAAGGQASVSVTTAPILACDAPSTAAAGALDDAFREYQAAAMHDAPIPFPWDMMHPPTEAQSVARRTLRTLNDVALKAQGEPLPHGFWSLLPEAPDEARRAAMVRGRRVAMEAALAAMREKGPVDEEVARIVIDDLGKPGPRGGAASEELRVRVASVGAVLDLMSFSFDSSLEGDRFRVRLGYVVPQSFDAQVLPLLRWLSWQCADVRLLLERRAGPLPGDPQAD